MPRGLELVLTIFMSWVVGVVGCGGVVVGGGAGFTIGI